MGYLRSVIRPTHWVTSILNIGKKMKNLPLFCLYRLLKNSAIFIVLMHSSDNFIGLVNMTLPSDVHFLSDEIQYNQLIHQCRRYKSNLLFRSIYGNNDRICNRFIFKVKTLSLIVMEGRSITFFKYYFSFPFFSDNIHRLSFDCIE
jgi:hypothetical protein